MTMVKTKTVKVLEIIIGNRKYEIEENEALRWGNDWMIQIADEQEALKLEQYFNKMGLNDDDIQFEVSTDDSDWEIFTIYDSVDDLIAEDPLLN